MNTMINCYIKTVSKEYKAENEWDQLGALIAADQLNIYYITARFVISQVGEEDMIFEDDMGPLIQNLLLLSSQHLLNDEDYSFNYWGYKGTVQMNHENEEEILIEGDYIQSTTYPKRALVKAMLDSAKKMMQLMKNLHEADENFEIEAHEFFLNFYNEAMTSYTEKYSR